MFFTFISPESSPIYKQFEGFDQRENLLHFITTDHLNCDIFLAGDLNAKDFIDKHTTKIVFTLSQKIFLFYLSIYRCEFRDTSDVYQHLRGGPFDI